MQCSEDGAVVWRKQDSALNVHGEEDIWDDSALIKAYDKAIASLSNKEEQHGEQSLSSDSVAKKSTRRRKKSKKSKRLSNDKKGCSKNWMIGDKCLALFEADQLYYDATILNIDHETRVVKVKYEGYGNEEEINLNKILPLEFKQDMETFQVDDIAEEAELGHGGPSTKSGGDKVKGNLQFAGGWRISDICYVQDDRGSFHQVVINSFISSSRCMVTYIKSGKRKEVKVTQLKRTAKSHKKPHSSHHRSHMRAPSWFPPNMTEMPPPPPPPPSMFGFPGWDIFSSSHRVPPNFPPFPTPPPPMDIPDNILHEDEEEALANMLMSSYMNGYHTGYYQGLLQGRKSSQRNHCATSTSQETNASL